ncbi:hypothetical protein VTJ83DRAFT_435 [Remersonia thermophila]|uniref:Endoplasmic reticulum transmembrane protein n=1 Tax=Remersonia thermophila TaxID=72144 RepID=A0ABR4DNF7_9PEZI
MTLYYTLVFLLLVTEMALFLLLILPLPFTMRRKVFTFISENPLVAKVQYWLKITFVFILILFVDSVNRVYRVQLELAAASEATGTTANAIHGHERLEVQARKFYSQRNMYLCGFTLFLSLILNRTYTMILEVLRLEERLKQYEGTGSAGSPASGKKKPAGDLEAEVARLRAELDRRDRDLDTLKKQAQGLHKEYDSLADKYESTQKTSKDDSRKTK